MGTNTAAPQIALGCLLEDIEVVVVSYHWGGMTGLVSGTPCDLSSSGGRDTL